MRYVLVFFVGLTLLCCAGEKRFDVDAVPPIAYADISTLPAVCGIEEFFTRQGYELKAAGLRPPTNWERIEFGTIGVIDLDFRSVDQVPRWEHTYYRFTVIAEAFKSPEDAENRLAKLYVKPPPIPYAEPYKEFPLRRGFTAGNSVYTLTTDVNGFMPELERLIKDLEPAILKRDAGR